VSNNIRRFMPMVLSFLFRKINTNWVVMEGFIEPQSYLSCKRLRMRSKMNPYHSVSIGYRRVH